MTFTTFLLSIMAGVIADSISGRLDERDGGDEPGARPCSQYGYRKEAVDKMRKPFVHSPFSCALMLISFAMKPQEGKPKAQPDWLGFCKGGAQCPQSGRLCV